MVSSGRWNAAALTISVLVSPVMPVEPSKFDATTTRDLVALCAEEPDDSLYTEAKQFCYGFLAGVAQCHRSIVLADGIEPIACRKHEVTLEQVAGVCLDWGKASPQLMDDLPVESLRRAATAEWPCAK